MKRYAIDDAHPIVILIYIVALTIIQMKSLNPIMLLIGYISASAYLMYRGKLQNPLKGIIYNAFFLIAIGIINAFACHSGITRLFKLGRNYITLEAIIWGMHMGLLLIVILRWCQIYKMILADDKFLYLFGRVSRVGTLMVSMSFRYLGKLKKQYQVIENAAHGIGLYDTQNPFRIIKQKITSFSTLISMSLEDSIETGDQMEARGYGLPGRTSFHRFSFKANDTSRALFIALLSVIPIFSSYSGKINIYFYPKYSFANITIYTILTYILYTILCFTPFIIEGVENTKWR